MKIFIKIVLAIMIFISSFIGTTIALDNLPTGTVSVGVAATEILATNYKRKGFIIYNVSAPTIYIDNFAVECSTSTSFPLRGGAAITFEDYKGAIWGIVDVTTGTIKVIYTQY